MQLTGATVAAVAAFGALFTAGQLAASAVGLSNSVSKSVSRHSEIAAMEARVEGLKADVAAVKLAARTHATRLEARQAGLAALLAGHADDQTLLSMVPAVTTPENEEAADVALAFSKLDDQQIKMASALQKAADARYAATAGLVRKLGINADAIGAMGGPYEPVPANAIVATEATTAPAPAATAAPTRADPQFRALFDSWKRLDTLQTSMISIPSAKPVNDVALTSGFGVRRDPFRGGRAMHAGVDIPGPLGTPIYATADAIVGRTGWVGGYGNMVELEHGKGIQTRYGHMSSVLVAPGTRIKRGQQIGLMGSTGRSTGSHLHYEVRLDGRAVNPMPFLRTADYLMAMQKRSGPVEAMGGPEGSAGSK
jgi:murein DD-endopeptidase MepM/ murein hydrolase activator NlpD